MSQFKLLITLMSIVAVIIIGMAIFVFTHLSGLNLTQGIALIGLAVFGLIIVIFIIFLVMRSIKTKK
jgi:hypothetical protein